MNRTALALPVLAVVLSSTFGCGTPTDEFVSPDVVECDGQDGAGETVRFASYNIQATKSAPIEEVGDVIEHVDADVIALQEVHKNIPWTGDIDQAQVLADRFGYQLAYAATLAKSGGSQGVALLSRLPFARVERVDLDAPLQMEPRVAIDAEVCAGGERVQVVATHNDVFPWSGEAHAKEVLQHVQPTMGKGVLVAGDFNALPDWAGPLSLVHAGLVDLVAEHGEVATFVGDLLPRRLDFIFADEPIAARVRDTGVVDERASDHLPLWADVAVDVPADDG
jgi:endonuclease/exonuclease/phosphatase family metal-dependent hydrolase